ncbi:MAG: FtsX-like permease family protein [Saprospiraceae bacterium]
MRYEPWIARKLMASGGGGFTRIILWIATGAVGLSVAVMIVSLALMTGFKHEITRKMFGFWGHIHISDPRSVRSYEALPFEYDSTLVRNIENIRKVDYTPPAGSRSGDKVQTSKGGVHHVQAYIYLPGIITYDEQLEGIVLKGIGKDYDWNSINQFRVSDSTWSSLAIDELIISHVTATRLRLKVGDKLILHFVRENQQLHRRFTIKGIYKTGLEENDSKFALASIDRVRELLGWSDTQVSGIEIAIDNIDDLNLITDYIYQEEIPPHLYAENIKEKFPSLFEWLELQDINTIVIIGLMLAVAIINMITALLILILERTQMIGILKSMGARDKSIRQVFLWFAMFITIGGILIGNLLGLGLVLLEDKYQFIKLNEADYYLDYAPVMVLPWHLLVVNIGALFIIGICLIAPSFLVSKINPIKTIHFN